MWSADDLGADRSGSSRVMEGSSWIAIRRAAGASTRPSPSPSRAGRPLLGFGWHKSPPTTWDEETGRGEAYFTFVYGANVAEVEVDAETGKVEVLNVTAAHDVGRAISPAMVRSQICGGIAMGLGYGVLENFGIDHGIPASWNLDEYLIATSLDMPEVEAIIVENPDPLGPFGAKSIGEPATEIAAPAIVNAIAHAVGRRVRDLPADLEMVLLGRRLTKVSPLATAPGFRGNGGTDMRRFRFSRIESLDELLDWKARFGTEARPIAGGTDLIVAMREGRPRSSSRSRSGTSRRTRELKGIRHRGGVGSGKGGTCVPRRSARDTCRDLAASSEIEEVGWASRGGRHPRSDRRRSATAARSAATSAMLRLAPTPFRR